MARILIIDDEPQIRSSLKSALERRKHDVVTARNYAEGTEYFEVGFDLIFLDVLLPDGNGLDLLRHIRSRNKDQMVVMISGHADISMAVEALRSGSYDFIEKPISLDRVLVTIENATRNSHLVAERERLASIVYGDFIGNSEPIVKLKADIALSASMTSRFLIVGENGTGKELVAHMIHRHSSKANGPFVAVNCAALPKELVESELFGHTRGAFTGATRNRKGFFQEAAGGAIFLDEISEMPLAAQAKILRAIETKQITSVGADTAIDVDCNIIAATNRNIDEMIAEGSFRQDLFYRLNVVQLRLPPLRERPDDLPQLAEYFLEKFATESGLAPKKLTGEAIRLLQRYSFPGNVRELKNLMERVNIYCRSTKVAVEQLSPLMPPTATPSITRLKDAVGQFEYEYIRNAIAHNNGNIAETARQLGLERSHLYKKLKKLTKDSRS